MENQEYSQDSRTNMRELRSSEDSFSLGKLAFLGVLSIALYKFLPLAMLTPVPLIFGILLFGRSKTVLLATICSIALWFLAKLGTEQVSVQLSMASVVGYLLFYLNGALIGEVILRKVHPVRGLLTVGMIVVAISSIILAVYIATAKTPIVEQIENSLIQTFEVAKKENPGVKEALEGGGTKALQLQDMLNKPDEIAKGIVEWIPAGIFISVFLGLYLSLMIVLRNGILWKNEHPYPFSMKSLLKFEVPFPIIYLVIFSLALLLGKDYVGGDTASMVGSNILYCLGIFYFFQGFGVLIDFLKWVNIVGFFRSMLVVVTLWSAWKIVVLVGLFDTWVNFRKFFKKNKNNEGDKQ